MKRRIFSYDEVNKVFVEIHRGIKWWVKTVLIGFLCSIALAVLYYMVYSKVYNTREEIALEADNARVEQEIASLEKRLGMLDSTLSWLQYRDRNIYRTIFHAEPPAMVSIERELFEQSDIDTGKIDRLIERSTFWVKQLETRASMIDIYIKSVESEFDQLGSDVLYIPSIVPVEGFSVNQVGASFGSKVNPFLQKIVNHNGIDLLSSSGTKVLAAATGVVESVATSTKGDGNVLAINHLNGYKTRYCHLEKVLVHRGQRVQKGDVVAIVGNSGVSLVPHLHYEVMYCNKYVDPINYFFAQLTPRNFRQVMSISYNAGQSLD